MVQLVGVLLMSGAQRAPGSRFNHYFYPTDLIFLVVLWRLQYKLSLRDLTEMFLERGFEFTMRRFETGKPLCLTHDRPTADKTTWTSRTVLVRRGDLRQRQRDGNLVDSMLSEQQA